jgi:hypothetical protein
MMRKWGVFISLFYAVIVLGLLVPVGVLLVGDDSPRTAAFYADVTGVYESWLPWIPIAMVLSGQALLLFLSVDTSWKRLKPRVHVAVTCGAAAILLALLSVAAILALAFTVPENRWSDLISSAASAFGLCAALWICWGILFYFYARNSEAVAARAVSWLLKGSVLELLVVVPCHVIVRRRHDCCAPVVTSFGIVTGIAVMLLSFGPSVLLLYRKRLDAYSKRGPA